jgi:hypothetical protein
MADVKRSDKTVGPAPAINYDFENPPNELKQDFKINAKEGNLGYLSVGKFSSLVEPVLIYFFSHFTKTRSNSGKDRLGY